LLVQPILHKLFLFQILLNKGGKVVVKFSFKIRADSMIERFFIHLGLTKIEPDQKFPRPIAADGEKQLQEVIVILFAEIGVFTTLGV
jgi:hypothetical protein